MRKEIHREVTGLTAEQIHGPWVAAGGLESREDRPGPLSTEDRLAAVRRNELKRIWTLMPEDGWEAYSPESDPDVHRWEQARRDRQERESAAAVGPEPELIRYRIVAQRTDPEHPGAVSLTHYAYAQSAEEAVAKVRQAHEKPGGVYGDQGMYRVVEVAEESWESGLRQQEETRRRYLTTILESATTTVRGREPQNPDAGLVSRLDDFFTRAVTFPDLHGSGGRPRPHQATFGWTSERPYIEHASDPGRALALFLLAYLDHYGLELGAAVRTGDRSVASPVGEGWPSARGAEGGEAAPEIVERVMDICGQHYAAVTGTSPEQWDQESSREVVGIALRTVRITERNAYPQALETYLSEHRARLERLWQRYGPDGMFAGEVVLIDLPGCLVLCERIDNSPLWLERSLDAGGPGGDHAGAVQRQLAVRHERQGRRAMSRQSAASAPELSTDPRQRMGNYQTMAVNARMRICAVLAAAGLEPGEADELVRSVEVGAVAGGHCWVEEKFAMAPDERGEAYGEGWDGGVSAATATLVSTADSAYRQRGRALTTSAVMKLGEIIHNRLQTAEQDGPADTVNSGEGGRSNV